MTASPKPKLILAILVGVCASATADAEERIMFSTGGAQIRNTAGDLRPAVKGAEIRPGETIVTPPGGYVQAKMQAGFMAVRPDSQVRIDTPSPSIGQTSVSANQVTLQQGAIRMMTSKQEGTPKTDAPTSPRMVIVTPNANIAMSNADGEAMITPPKTMGAAPTTISVINSGAASIQGATGAPVQVQAHQGATIAGKAAPSVMMAAALPALPSMHLKIAPATGSSTTAPAGTQAIPQRTAASSIATAPGAGKMGATAPLAPALTAPSATLIKPPMVSPMPAISPVAPPLATAPIIKPPVAPMTAPIVMPQPVITPVVAPTIMPKPVIVPVISPVIAPLPVISPIVRPPLTCMMVLINGVNQQVCR